MRIVLGALALVVLRAGVTQGQPKPVIVVQSGEAATLDWHMHCDKNAHEPDRQIFDTLLRRDLKTLKLEGNLAESWRLLNETTWQFKLRRGIKFHSGEPLDAAAVKYSIERMLNPKQGAPGRTSIATIDHVDVVDASTVNVVTSKPFPLLPVRMSPGHCGTVGIVPPKYIEQVGDAGFAVKPVGSGPYKFVEWVKDERLVLEANRDYHRGAPALERLVFRPVPELTTRVAALLSGQADLVSDVPPDQVAKIKASGVARTEVSTLGGFVIMVKMTNYLMPGPWQDVRVRRAINYAIDMDTIIKTVLEGYGQVLGVPLEREVLPAYMTAWGGAGLFDGDLLVNSLHSKSALPIHRNEALDKILEDAQGTNDPDKRRALYFKAQEVIFEDAPIIKAYQQAHIFGISSRLDWKPWIDNMLFLYDARLK